MTSIQELCVNIDHVATLRQARQCGVPSVSQAAKTVIAAGAKGVTIHLREDRRHIQDHDLRDLRPLVPYLNLEMANTAEMRDIAVALRPNAVCLVPEKREELTTEGGLDTIRFQDDLSKTSDILRSAGVLVSMFVEPNRAHIQAAHRSGAQIVEIHTGSYANLPDAHHLEAIRNAAEYAASLGLIVHAGHGLDLSNLPALLPISEISDFNIGFSIISEALFVGLHQAVLNVRQLLNPL